MTTSDSIFIEHPNSWVGEKFKNKITGNIHKVIEVRKRHSRYRVLLEGPAILSQVGFDSRRFVRNWEHVNS